MPSARLAGKRNNSAYLVERRKALLKKRAAAIKRNPVGFAAYSTAKQMGVFPRGKNASVIFDRENAGFGRAVASELARRGIRTSTHRVNPKAGFSGMGVRERRRVGRLAAKNISVFATADRGGKLDRVVDKIVDSVERRGGKQRGTKLALAYGITPAITRKLLTADGRLMRRFTRMTFEAVRGCRSIRVQTRSGTDIRLGFSRGMRWVQDNGVFTKSYWGNLPAGEVFTSPQSANGRLVLNGVMNGVGMLSKNPIAVEIRNGNAVPGSVRCSDPALKARFLRAISADRNASRIGELGLGTNPAVRKLSGNDLVDEKYAGVHFGFGDPLGADTGAKWASKDHHDAVLRGATVTVDGRKIMDKGKSLLQ